MKQLLFSDCDDVHIRISKNHFFTLCSLDYTLETFDNFELIFLQVIMFVSVARMWAGGRLVIVT